MTQSADRLLDAADYVASQPQDGSLTSKQALHELLAAVYDHLFMDGLREELLAAQRGETVYLGSFAKYADGPHW